MFPAQALAEVMLKQGWRVKLSTDARGARYATSFPKETEIIKIKSATFARGTLLAKLSVLPTIIMGVVHSVASMRRDSPSVVIGFGGYPTIPAMSAALILKKPRMLHEQNGVLGRVNQLFANRVHRLACGTWPTRVPAGVQAEHVGNPVRDAILQSSASIYKTPKQCLDTNQAITILVLGGSQGARILSQVVPEAIALLSAQLKNTVVVYQQARAEDKPAVEAFYKTHNIASDVQTFFDDVPMRLVTSQLVIARSGASTVADISVVGRPAIFIPLATAIRNEQEANAQGLVDAKAAQMIIERDFNATNLAERIEAILTKPDTAAKMAAAALSVAKPGAADELAKSVRELADLV